MPPAKNQEKIEKNFEALGFTLTPDPEDFFELSHDAIDWELPPVPAKSLPALLLQMQGLHKSNLLNWFQIDLGFYLTLDYHYRICLLDQTQTENSAYLLDTKTGRLSDICYSAGGPEYHGLTPANKKEIAEFEKMNLRKRWGKIFLGKEYGVFQIKFPKRTVRVECSEEQDSDHESGAIDKLIRYSKGKRKLPDIFDLV